MPFSDYTSPDTVRAVLGVSSEEIEDPAIDNAVYLTGILEALYRLHPNLAANYLTTRNVSSRSVAQNRFVLLVETYSAYTVALQLIPSLPMSAPKDITDGKAGIARVADPYKHLQPTISASMSYFKDSLFDAYKAVFPNVVLPSKLARPMMSSTGIGFDPVTGV